MDDATATVPETKCVITTDEPSAPLRLNLGAGEVAIDGYVSIDRKNGHEVYPLDYPDNSVDDIYASHVLEHFEHGEVRSVVKHWVDKLRPGGRLRLAVPNFEWVAKEYLAGNPVNSVGYVMGGQVDEDDFHKSIFDSEFVNEIMMSAGLERIGRFAAEYDDCSQLPVSLNRVGYKPVAAAGDINTSSVVAVLSAPRFGPVMHFRNVGIALGNLRIPYYVCQGAYWHQVLSEQLEECLQRQPEFILTIDYDSVFSQDEVKELLRLAAACPEADAICALQMKRGCEFALFGILDSEGKPRSKAYAAEFDRYLVPISTGHFGLTLFRADSLANFPRPWFVSKPNDEGRWDKGAEHPDIGFWRSWQKAGLKLFLAPRLPIGHIEEVVKWPTSTLQPFYQDAADYHENGIPAEVAR